MSDRTTEQNQKRGAAHGSASGAMTLSISCLLLIFFSGGAAQALLTTSDQIVNFDDLTSGLDGSDNFGSGVATGDVNGDGILDLIIGARGDDDGATNRGAVYILFRNGAGFIVSQTKITDPAGDPDDVLTLGAGWFGQSVEWLGDYDGDGYGELAVGEFLSDSPTNSGRVWIIGLDSAGIPRDAFAIASGSTNFDSLSAEARFGFSIANLGDWDSDGAPEIAVGALLDGDGGAENGAVYILYLDPSSSAVEIKGFLKISDTAGGFDGGFDPPTWFGASVTSVGDLDGDGQVDLAIGARKRGTAGAVWVLFMDSDCQIDAASCSVLPGAVEIAEGVGGFEGTLGAGDQFGSGLAFLADGSNPPGTLAVGAHLADLTSTNFGALWLLTLEPDGTVVDEARISNGENTGFGPGICESNIGGQFGFDVASAGDLDGDGTKDLLIGAIAKDDGAVDAGAAYLLTLASNTNPNLVANGSFEAPTGASGFTHYKFSTVSNPFIPSWTLVSGSVDHVHSNGSCSQQNMDLTGLHAAHPGEGRGTISQTITTEPGQPYLLLYEIGGPDVPHVKSGVASVQGSGGTLASQVFSIDNGGALTTTFYDSFELPFVADSASTTIQFESYVNSSFNGPHVDQVRVFKDVQDLDFDGLGSLFDNCPVFYNPGQEDADGDGIGDFCDNCYLFNPLQENTGGDPEVGDACDLAFLFLRPVPIFDLSLLCGGLPVAEVNIGLRIPFGAVPSTANFGGGCDEPVVSPASGVPTGLGCSANPDLGTDVDAANSGAYGPGLSSPFSDEAVYVQMRGNGVGGRLCDAYPPSEVFLGRFTTGPGPGFSGASGFVYSGLFVNGLERGLDTNGNPVAFAHRNSGAGDPDLEIIMKPAAGEDEATATKWSLCISKQTDQRMHRISVGLRVPGATTADIRVEGCDTTPDGSGVRDCTGTVGATVDEANSFTMGPFAAPTAPVVNDTLYVVVEGSAAAPGATTLNPTQFQEWCVATIEVDAPPGVAGIPPEFVTDGLALLPYSDATTDAWQTSSTLLDPLTLEQVALDNGFNQGDDLDGDGVLDAADNCPFTANADLSNNGDFQLAGTDLDEEGDACECADANGSGAVFDSGTPDPSGNPLTPDLDLIRQHLVGSNTDPAVAAVCSVYEGPECDTKDAVVLQRALNAQAPGIAPLCDAALPD